MSLAAASEVNLLVESAHVGRKAVPVFLWVWYALHTGLENWTLLAAFLQDE